MVITRSAVDEMAKMGQALLNDYVDELDEAFRQLPADETTLSVTVTYKLQPVNGKLMCVATMSFTAKKIKDRFQKIVYDPQNPLFPTTEGGNAPE